MNANEEPTGDIIEDYLDGKEIDPLAYDQYQFNRLKEFLGDTDEDDIETFSAPDDYYDDFGVSDTDGDW